MFSNSEKNLAWKTFYYILILIFRYSGKIFASQLSKVCYFLEIILKTYTYQLLHSFVAYAISNSSVKFQRLTELLLCFLELCKESIALFSTIVGWIENNKYNVWYSCLLFVWKFVSPLKTLIILISQWWLNSHSALRGAEIMTKIFTNFQKKN